MRKTLIGLTIAVSIGAATMGCSRDSGNTTVDLGSNASTVAASTTPADPSKAAADQALAVAARYYQTLSRVDSDYSVPVSAIDEVAGGPAATTSKADVTVRRSKGVTITGTIQLVSSTASDIRTDPMPATAKVQACVDVSSRAAKYPDGSSAMGQGGTSRIRQTLTLENPKWPDAAGWRVVGNSALETRTQEPCDA